MSLRKVVELILCFALLTAFFIESLPRRIMIYNNLFYFSILYFKYITFIGYSNSYILNNKQFNIENIK